MVNIHVLQELVESEPKEIRLKEAKPECVFPYTLNRDLGNDAEPFDIQF